MVVVVVDWVTSPPTLPVCTQDPTSPLTSDQLHLPHVAPDTRQTARRPDNLPAGEPLDPSVPWGQSDLVCLPCFFKPPMLS